MHFADPVLSPIMSILPDARGGLRPALPCLFSQILPSW
jgi:hypothetical protein